MTAPAGATVAPRLRAGGAPRSEAAAGGAAKAEAKSFAGGSSHAPQNSAAIPAAVARQLSSRRFLPLGPQKVVIGHPVGHVPRERDIPRERSGGHCVRGGSRLLKGLSPGCRPELLRPGIESGSFPPGRLHDRGSVFVPPRKRSLEIALTRLRHGKPDPRLSQARAEQTLTAHKGLPVGHRRPLERGERLGNESIDAHVQLQPPRTAPEDLPSGLAHPQAKVDDGRDVVVRLPGKTDHEVQLQGRPSGPERLLGRRENVIHR